MKKLGKLLLAVMLGLTLSGCGGESSSTSSLDKIKEAGVLKVGVKDDRINFGLKDTATGEYTGYEIDIVKQLAKEILGDETKVEFTPVNAKTRTGLLDNGEIDVVVATFTITDERKESWNFSDPYYQDNVGILAKKGKYTGLKDMDGAVIAVQQSATSQDAVKEAADKIGVTVSFKEYGSAPECVTAVNSGVVDAYSIDVTALMSYLNDDTEILPDRFSPQEFGIATRKGEADQALTDKVNEVVKTLQDNGTLDQWQADYGIKQ